jgi:adenosylmethionine-8-amino-7-oxononanoate aminotransferase
LLAAACNQSVRLYAEAALLGRGNPVGLVRRVRHNLRRIAAEDAGYSSSVRDSLYRFFLDKGILLRPLGDVVYVVPPYAITAADLHRIWDAIGEAVDCARPGF